MKKILCLGMLFSICFLTACTKNYKNFDEFEKAMNVVKTKNSSYTIEAKQQVGTIELYYRSYIKGDKWKVETSMNGGSSYMSTVLFNGVELLNYSEGSPYAMINPVTSMLKDDDESVKIAVNAQNPVYPLYNWKNGYDMFDFNFDNDKKPIYDNKVVTKNGFECRMVKFDEDKEACISDKYGIAVYQKLTTENRRHIGEKQEIELNLVKVDTNDIPDSTFELPSGVRKMTMDKMLNNLSNMFKNY